MNSTLIRVPLMQGLPPRIAGSEMMRSNMMHSCASLDRDGPHLRRDQDFSLGLGLDVINADPRRNLGQDEPPLALIHHHHAQVADEHRDAADAGQRERAFLYQLGPAV